jgi:2,3-diketo-5-methylthio-1-phosphopentane phosphatase
MKLAVFVDFDDTVTVENVAHFLLAKYARAATERSRAMYRSGEITFREYQERSFDAVSVPLSEMQAAAAAEMRLRPGFIEMIKAVQAAGGTVTVVSAGLDIYIRPVLDENGLSDVPLICGSAECSPAGSGPFRYDYFFGNAPCEGDWATCKCAALQSAGDGCVTIFVGDGASSDACAAAKADYVFARDRLLRHCAETGIPATPFENFYTVTEFVSRLTAGQRPELTEQR